MKTPAEVKGKLTADQIRQVNDLEKQVEEKLANDDEIRFDINEVRATTSEAVFDELILRAKKAGWQASRNGAIVVIRNP